MTQPNNVLWIMCDQLRFDYLGCTGHPTLKTPNIDAMAKRGVRFSNAYVQSPICGPSRMSFYTGRYMRSRGSHWNGWLLVHADKAARVAEEDSETPHITRRAMDFIAEAETDGRPWCLHLSDHDRPAQPAMKIRRSTPASPSDVPAYYIRLHCQLKSYQSCHRDVSRFKAARLNKHSRKTKNARRPSGHRAGVAS